MTTLTRVSLILYSSLAGPYANKPLDFQPGRSRNGVVRNTDSFFKDDTLETKKISLTPNLLRDDSLTSQQPDKDSRVRGSFESYDKVSPGDKNKDDKKRKDKKPGMLSGLFKRRDRKTKATDDDDDQEKISEESIRSSTPTGTMGDHGRDGSKPAVALQRTPSKLQKTPPGEQQGSGARHENGRSTSRQEVAAPQSPPATKQTFQSHGQQQQQQPHQPQQQLQQHQQHHQQRPQPRSSSAQGTRVRSPEVLRPLTNKQDRSMQERPEPNLSLVKEPRDSSESAPDASTHLPANQAQHQYSSSQTSTYSTHSNKKPVSVSHAADPVQQDPELNNHYDDNFEDQHSLSHDKDQYSSKQTGSPSPTASPAFSQDPTLEDDRSQEQSVSPSTSIIPAWNDSGLRAYMDDGSDIRDLLTIVHDKSNVPAAGPDHPLIGSLFREESKALNDMSSRLDDMLNSWLSKSSLSP